MKPGRSLEKFVAHLESILSDKENVKIESPKKLRDKETGVLREFDIIMTLRRGHHELKIAFECRDRLKPVDAPQVEGYIKKCQDTDINQGIIVSPRGFYKPAIKKAKANNILCLSLQEVESFDWLKMSSLEMLEVKIDKVNKILFRRR